LVSKSDFNKISRSKLTAPTKQYPIYYTTSAVIAPSSEQQLLLKISPTPSSLSVNGLTNPVSPNWAFTVGSLGQYVYDPNSSINFELDISEQTNIIISMLKYFGIIINNPTIIQVAEQESQSVEINEKS
jgi:hypothetical protein